MSFSLFETLFPSKTQVDDSIPTDARLKRGKSDTSIHKAKREKKRERARESEGVRDRVRVIEREGRVRGERVRVRRK